MSRLLDLSADTIRYYMELGLIVPNRNGNLYDFTEDCLEDIRQIHKLKEMGFSLKEVQRVLALRRTSNWVEPQDIAEYLMLLEDKKKELSERIDTIYTEIGRIEEEQKTVAQLNGGDAVLIGVPLRALEYLRCPCCGSFFSVEEAQMNSRYIYSGRLFCNCGYVLFIQDGIILAPDARKDTPDEADLGRKRYKDLPASVVTAMQRTYNFMLHRIRALPLSDKVILETDIHCFFYLYTHFRKIENRALFIVTDPFWEILKMYKERIEYMKLDLDIVYLSCEGASYPLKPECVDLRIDYFSANKRFFQAERCMKKDGEVIGCYFTGENQGRHFSYKDFCKSFSEHNYQCLKERRISCPPEIGEQNGLCLYEFRKNTVH